MVAFRGSLDGNLGAWGRNLQCWTDPRSFHNCSGWVHHGWGSGYDMLRTRLITAVRLALEARPTYRLVVTGHSAGGALASIFVAELATFGAAQLSSVASESSAYRAEAGSDSKGKADTKAAAADESAAASSSIAWESVSEVAPLLRRPLAPPPLYITFAAPMAGNREFAAAIDSGLAAQGNAMLRVVNARDPAVRAPNTLNAGGSVQIPCPMGGEDQFSHAGQEVWLTNAADADMSKAQFCNSSGAFGDGDDASMSDPNPLCSSSLGESSLTWVRRKRPKPLRATMATPQDARTLFAISTCGCPSHSICGLALRSTTTHTSASTQARAPIRWMRISGKSTSSIPRVSTRS